MIARDLAFEAAVIERLGGLEFGAFGAPQASEIRVLAEERQILRPSRMGNCERRLALELAARPIEEEWSIRSRHAVDFGSYAHRLIQAALPDLAHEVPVRGPWLRGSMDTIWSATTAVDWKTARARNFVALDSEGPKSQHQAQLTWYAQHARRPLGMLVYLRADERRGAKTSAVDADHVRAFRVPTPAGEHPHDAKAARLLAHQAAGTLPELSISGECRWCPLSEPCMRLRLQTEETDMEPTTALATTTPYGDIERMALAIVKSRLFGITEPEQAIALMLLAQAEGLHPATAARDYHIIQGRPSLKADAMMARFLASGGRVEWHELTDASVIATFSHPQGGVARIDWTMERARRAELGKRDMWIKYPRQMLRARVISEGIRTVCPGVAIGIYTPEEVADFSPVTTRAGATPAARCEVIEATPIPPPKPAAPPSPISPAEAPTRAQMNAIAAGWRRVWGTDVHRDSEAQQGARVHLQAVTAKSSRTELTRTEASAYIDALQLLPDFATPHAS